MKKYHILIDNLVSDNHLDTTSLMSTFPDIKDSIVPLVSYECKSVRNLCGRKSNTFFENRNIYNENVEELKYFITEYISSNYPGNPSTKILQHLFLRKEKSISFLESITSDFSENKTKLKQFVNSMENIKKLFSTIIKKFGDSEKKYSLRDVLTVDWLKESSSDVEKNVCQLLGYLINFNLNYNDEVVGDFGITNIYNEKLSSVPRLTLFLIN